MGAIYGKKVSFWICVYNSRQVTSFELLTVDYCGSSGFCSVVWKYLPIENAFTWVKIG